MCYPKIRYLNLLIPGFDMTCSLSSDRRVMCCGCGGGSGGDGGGGGVICTCVVIVMPSVCMLLDLQTDHQLLYPASLYFFVHLLSLPACLIVYFFYFLFHLFVYYRFYSFHSVFHYLYCYLFTH